MNLPIGYEGFKDLRGDQCYYVDKTDLIYKMITSGRHYFLSRPRRFGKSLLVSTLECLFEGKKELFKGLYIEDKWTWSTKYPVVRFSFTDRNRYTDSLDNTIGDQLLDYEEEHGLDPSGRSSPQGRFRRLVKHLHRKTGQQVVVLVDEYDAPILDVLTDTDLVKKNSDDLKDFYRVFKNCSKHIRFVFVTGISMFSKDTVFSGLNNLNDISLHQSYATICGYTDNDLDTVFAEEVKKLDRNKIKRWYNGYNWLGEEKVYNPFGILNLFDKKKFKGWWIDTGAPQYLYKYLNALSTLSIEKMENYWIDSRDISTFNVDRLVPQALLFQSGYLTIAKEKHVGRKTKYLLKSPNLEVRDSVYDWLLKFLTNEDEEKEKEAITNGKQMLNFMEKNDFDGLENKMQAFFASIPYQLNKSENHESDYHKLIYAILYGASVEFNAEQPTHLGASDITILYKGQIFIIEFKMQQSSQTIDKALQNAIQQIKDRRYADQHKGYKGPIHILGIVFNKEERNVVGIRHEKLK
ncbi:MAG: AAA family ATPase [Proteobacteria bacterium]|nr:AAA family ATPase [Pseudomonadota bacterium]